MVLRQGDLAKLYTFTAKKRDILGCTSLTTKGNLKGQEKILKVGRGEHNTSRSRKFAAKKSTLREYQATVSSISQLFLLAPQVVLE